MTAVLHHLLVVFLVVAFPLWDRQVTRRLKASTNPRDRVRSYRQTIGWQLIATALLLATVPFADLLTPPVGKPFGIGVEVKAVLPILAGLALGVAIPLLLSLRNLEIRARQARALESLAFFLPRTGEQRRWFAALSVVVGVCEEIIFRGFLIRYMLALPLGLGLGGAVVAAAVVFGIDHGYQGWTGLLSTTVLALMMSALFLGSGSLWLPMLLHVLLDLRILLLLRRDDSANAIPG